MSISCSMPLQVHKEEKNDTCTSSTAFSPGLYKLHFNSLFSVTCWDYKINEEFFSAELQTF